MPTALFILSANAFTIIIQSTQAAIKRPFSFLHIMDIRFNPGRAAPEPDVTLMSDPFEIMLESEGKELLGLRYDYIAELLEESFEATYAKLFSSSRLHYEVINLISLSTPVMNEFGFPRRPNNKALKRAITVIIDNYLNSYGRNS